MGKNSHYETGDPELEAIINNIISSRPASAVPLDLKLNREGLNSLIDAGNQALSFEHVGLKTVEIPVEGGTISAFSYVPSDSEGANTTYPLLLDFHEGGFVIGKAAMDHNFCIQLCKEVGLSILNVDYRLAPEHPFPTATNDAYTALKWAIEHAEELKADISKGLFLCDASAGGNLSAALTIRARDDPSFHQKITGQILVYPELYSKSLHPIDKYKDDLTSYDEVTNDPIVPRSLLEFLIGIYEKWLTREQLTSSDRSPLLAHSLSNLPPALIFVSGKDPVRDEGILYAELLAKANGKDSVKLHVYPNAFHAFVGVAPQCRAAKKMMKELIEELKDLIRANGAETA